MERLSTAPLPRWIEFSRGGAPGNTTASLYALLEGVGGMAILGGVPLGKQFNRMVQDLWMQPGDRKAEETEKRKVPIPEPLPPVRPTDRRALPLRLEQLGRALPVPVLALIPEDAQDFGAPYGKTVAEFLSKILGPSEGCPHKWRRGVLLITTADWFTSCLPVPSDIID